eukprot:m.125532 g.125532  ORF g.125532 m.125532 type:complete len:789 (+) comp23470_c1_seq2:37-2403(+)
MGDSSEDEDDFMDTQMLSQVIAAQKLDTLRSMSAKEALKSARSVLSAYTQSIASQSADTAEKLAAAEVFAKDFCQRFLVTFMEAMGASKRTYHINLTARNVDSLKFGLRHASKTSSPSLLAGGNKQGAEKNQWSKFKKAVNRTAGRLLNSKDPDQQFVTKEGILNRFAQDSNSWVKCRLGIYSTPAGGLVKIFSPPKTTQPISGIATALIEEVRSATESELAGAAHGFLICVEGKKYLFSCKASEVDPWVLGITEAKNGIGPGDTQEWSYPKHRREHNTSRPSEEIPESIIVSSLRSELEAAQKRCEFLMQQQARPHRESESSDGTNEELEILRLQLSAITAERDQLLDQIKLLKSEVSDLRTLLQPKPPVPFHQTGLSIADRDIPPASSSPPLSPQPSSRPSSRAPSLPTSPSKRMLLLDPFGGSSEDISVVDDVLITSRQNQETTYAIPLKKQSDSPQEPALPPLPARRTLSLNETEPNCDSTADSPVHSSNSQQPSRSVSRNPSQEFYNSTFSCETDQSSGENLRTGGLVRQASLPVFPSRKSLQSASHLVHHENPMVDALALDELRTFSTSSNDTGNSIIPDDDQFATYEWYHGRMEREESARLVTQYGKSGSYLIRKSASLENQYVLSVNWFGKPRHLRITVSETETQISNMNFPSLFAMLEHFKSTPFPVSSRVRQTAPLCLTNYISNNPAIREASLTSSVVSPERSARHSQSSRQYRPPSTTSQTFASSHTPAPPPRVPSPPQAQAQAHAQPAQPPLPPRNLDPRRPNGHVITGENPYVMT